MKIGDTIFAAIDQNGEILHASHDSEVPLIGDQKDVEDHSRLLVIAGHARIVRVQIVQLPTRDDDLSNILRRDG